MVNILAPHRSHDITIEKNRSVQFLYFQDSDSIADVSHVSFSVQSGSRLELYLLYTGEGNATYQFDIALLGNGATVYIYALYLLKGDQKFELKTNQKHLAPQTCSNVSVNGYVAGNSQTIYTGSILIDKGGKYADAMQQHKQIIVEGAPEVISMPSLEVLHNEVYCTHGAAVDNFDQEAIFYLMSRGLSDREAKALLIENFFDFLFASFHNQKIKEQLLQCIKNKVRLML